MKYLLSIQIEMEADDDPAARKKAQDSLNSHGFLDASDKTELKLRCVYENKPPRSINLKLKKLTTS